MAAKFSSVCAAAIVALLFMPGGASAQASDARALIERAAAALGGADAILAVQTLELRGYGAEAYFWGGGNITADPDAMQKWAENPDFSTVWDFAENRYRTQYRHNFLFPFGGRFGHSFGLSAFGLDGDIGYVRADGAPPRRLARWTTRGQWFKPDGQAFRKLESLTHPLAAARAVTTWSMSRSTRERSR
jgi:hypothetical protein